MRKFFVRFLAEPEFVSAMFSVFVLLVSWLTWNQVLIVSACAAAILSISGLKHEDLTESLLGALLSLLILLRILGITA